jgi:lysophospholipase L1-like esterase
MIIKCDSDKIRYTGRWNINEFSATSTANGSYFEFQYSGECAVIGFDTSCARVPFPHIYISVDGGANIEVSLDRFIRIYAQEGEHKVSVVLKGSVESQNRWFAPIEAKVSLLEIEADEFLDLPEDTRPVIEFIGDSITEGISIDVGYSNYGNDDDMIYWDDSTAGYAWLTAKALKFRPVIMGYGCLGTTKGGAGGVPYVAESYKYYSDGYAMESQQADFIVINHGTNDRRADVELFKKRYFEFLGVVRERNPKAKIISLTPFSGCLAREIKESVEKHNKEKNDMVFYIDTTGWIEPEPLHPLRSGHKTVSEKLSEIIKEHLL